MPTLTSLTRAVNAVLRANFPDYKIYAGEVTEGFQRPSFFTQIIPLRGGAETFNYNSNRLMVSINFFNRDDTELENILMYDELVEAFGRHLRVEGRVLLLDNVRSSSIDETLQFRFDIDFYSREKRIDEHETMTELEIITKEQE